ncbi:MAG: hypothetical protein COU25_02605 [Candidatus Levybacteria bacterium CG10_big_fil_rev_8_21_14_0_10_35_13]|nr:MAG: hypothetical protein COU25_02605 [Candidatus Levybacteria bacterium CG10_big_fil_rev_8_21_14_0_10_35_13]
MAVTVAFIDGTNGTGITLSTADAVTNWTGATIDGNVVQIQGADCVSVKQVTGVNRIYYNYGSGIDMTLYDRHFYIWGMAASSGKLFGKVSGGIRIFMGTTATDYDEWYVDGSDTYLGGWKCFVMDINTPSNHTNGTGVTKTSVQYFGLGFNCLSGFTGNNKTLFVDAARVGSGLMITGGSSSDTGKFSEIYADDTSSSNQYGIIRRDAGAYIVQGELVFGDTAAATSYYFSDNNATVIFDDKQVSSTLYKIKPVAHASATTSQFQLGDKVGTGTSSIGTKAVTISAASISTTGSFTYSASAKTITRSTGSFITDGIKAGTSIRVAGTSNNDGVYTMTITGLADTTLTLSSGDTLVDEGPVTSTLTASRRFSFDASNANLKNLYLYGTTFNRASTINLGSTATALSTTTVEIVDTTFSDTNEVVKNITTSSPAPLYLRNKISFSTSKAGASAIAALNMYDAGSVDAGAFQVIESPKFESTATAGAHTVSGHTFTDTSINKPYITIQNSASAVWNMDNPTNGSSGRPTIGSAKAELSFAGTANGTVNERYVVTWSVKTPSGTAINTARVKIVETAPAVAVANQDSTDSGGAASSTYLRALYVPTGASTISATTHTPAAFKAYKYAYLGYVASATINQAVSTSVALLDDPYKVEATEATAFADGTQKVVFVESAADNQSHSIIKWSGGSGTLTAGQTVQKVGGAGATGILEEIIEGNSTAGTGIIKTRNTTAFVNGDSLDNNGFGWTATYTNSSEKRFYWLVQAGTISGVKRTLQQLYDHFQAKMSYETPLDSADGWDKVVTAGQAEWAIPLQGVSLGSPNSFKTLRNIVLNRGWIISGLNSLIGLSVYTANDGTTFTPASTATLEVNGVKTGTEPTNYVRIRIQADSGGPLTEGTEIMNTQATTSYGGSGYYKAVASFNYTSDQPVVIRARYKGYLPFETTGVITSTGLTVTAVWQIDPNFI